MVLVMLATMCWGSAQVIGKLALKNIGAILFNSIRFSVTAPMVVFVVFLTGGLGDIGGSWPVTAAVLSAIIGQFLATHMFFYSIKREAANRIIPAGNTHLFWIIAIAPIFLGETLSPVLPISAALIFAGIFFLIPREKSPDSWRMGVLVAAFSAFLWGVSSILSKYCLSAGMAVSILLLIRIFMAAALFDTVACISNRGKNQKINRRSIGLSVISGTLAFPVGTFLYFTALNIEQVSVLAPISGITIFFGFLFSILLIGERPTRKSIFGTILTIAGVLLVM